MRTSYTPSRRELLKMLLWAPASLLCLDCGEGNQQFGNTIQLENQKPGDADWELVNAAFNHEIEGYASSVSVNRGEAISIFVNSIDPSYTLDIYRIGWYGGAGARKMLPTITAPGIRQPIPQPDPTTGLIECQWTDPYVLQIPGDLADPTYWASGIYLAKLTGIGSGKQSYVIFVVRDDARPSDLLFQNTVTTYQAYNDWGGLSLYTLPQRAYKVSFNRPYSRFFGSSNFFRWECFMVHFLEREGYDVSYSTDLETHVNRNLLLIHRALLITGHDEYWSWQMRDNIEAARDTGVSLGFFSANTAYWQVRFDPSLVTGVANRTMVCYKQAFLDPYYTDGNPDHQHLVTVRFRDSPVNRPEDALVGVMYETKTFQSFDIVVEDASHWIFANTGLVNGSHLTGLLGYEEDRMYGNAPPNTVRVAHSPYVNGGTYYADMTVYETAAGSTVVGVGSIQWSWGLDHFAYSPPLQDPNIPYNYTRSVASPAAQQITRNILARFIAVK